MKYLLTLSIFTIAFISYAQEQLQNGNIAPFFSAKDQFGKLVESKLLLKKGPLVVMFYRGYWCPNCNRQMSHVADSMKMITDLGASVVAITPEKSEYFEKTQKETNASFSFIHDENHKIMDDYKVTWQMGKTKSFFYKFGGINLDKSSGNKDRALPVPATYIIDQSGKIIGGYFNEDHTKRMAVSQIVKVLKKAGV
ncbi:MAG: AhpC/TSA family protein [Chloroflexia bacterium]|nr:AhpC/TSA family protein [Chloroflexia bacterium]